MPLHDSSVEVAIMCVWVPQFWSLLNHSPSVGLENNQELNVQDRHINYRIYLCTWMRMLPFLCLLMDVTKVMVFGGSNLHSHFGQCTIKKAPHSLMVNPLSHAGESWGPWHRGLIKRSPGWTPRAAWQTGHHTAPTHTPSINNACVSELRPPHSCCDRVFLWVVAWHCAPCEP